MAAYIDLNAVRAGLTTDPKDYRFCGYAEAVAGHPRAQLGVRSIVGHCNWPEAQARYREMIFCSGAAARDRAGVVSAAKLQSVIEERGQLPLPVVLRCRLRYFTDAAVLGTQSFVAMQLAAIRKQAGRHTRTTPRPLPACADWGDLTTMRNVRWKIPG
jgi:hypothetical protein